MGDLVQFRQEVSGNQLASVVGMIMAAHEAEGVDYDIVLEHTENRGDFLGLVNWDNSADRVIFRRK